MREALNEILSFIGAESLTDQEFDSIELESMDDQQAVYEALFAVVVAREAVSTIKDQLKYYFLAKGVSIEEQASGTSNIFIGARL